MNTLKKVRRLTPDEIATQSKTLKTVQLDSSELATILAALRHWQSWMQTYEDRNVPFYPSHEGFGGYFADHAPLPQPQIDELCERINFAHEQEDPVIVIEGGVVQSVFTPTGDDKHPCKPVTYSLIDYDNFRGGDMSDKDFVEEWNSFSPRIKKYYRAHCKDEFEKYFEDRINEACTCDDRSWHGPEHDSACPVEGER